MKWKQVQICYASLGNAPDYCMLNNQLMDRRTCIDGHVDMYIYIFMYMYYKFSDANQLPSTCIT